MNCELCDTDHGTEQTCPTTGRSLLSDLDHDQCVSRMESLTEEIERLANRDDLTEADEQRWNDLTREFERVDERRRALKREADLRRVRQSMNAGHTRSLSGTEQGDMDVDVFAEPGSVPSRRGGPDPFDLSNVRTFNRTPEEIGGEFKARARRAIETMPGLTPQRREGATGIIERWDNEAGDISRHALVAGHPDYLRAFSKLAKFGPHAVLDEPERRALNRAMSLTDSAGGYLVPFQLDPTVIITSDGSFNQVRQIARQVIATGDVWNGVSAGQVDFSWDGEATEVSDDAPTFAQPTVTVHKAQGFVPISIEALQDAQNVTQEIGRLLAFGKDTLESTAFVSGSGTSQPWGVVAAIEDTDGGSPDRTVDAPTAETFDAAAVKLTLNSLPARYRMNAKWLANNLTYQDIRDFASNDGPDMWADSLREGRPERLLGKEVYEAEEMDDSSTINAAATADNFILLAGDFENYVVADRIGFQVELVPHLFGSNRRPTGQRGWYAYFRVGADSVNDGAFRLLNVATAA